MLDVELLDLSSLGAEAVRPRHLGVSNDGCDF